MYEFWYDYIKRKYQDSAHLLYTDTDSVLFSCQTEDIYQDMHDSNELFDFSEYPQEHFLRNDGNKKVPGKMKDETHGEPISEFIALRSKMYSFLCRGKECKRAKGISKVTVKKDLKHAYYKDTLFGKKSVISTMKCLRNRNHELFCQTIQKTSLCPFDDKRYLIDAVRSYAYGHYKIKDDARDVIV